VDDNNPSDHHLHSARKTITLGSGLVIGLVFGSYESVCITSAVVVTLPKFASDELSVWRVDCIPKFSCV